MRVISSFLVSAVFCACVSLLAVDGSKAGPRLQDKDRNASLIHGVMPGTVATVYVQPSGLPAGAASWRTLKGHGLWCNSSWWSQYLLVRDNDARMLKASLGNTKYPSVIIYFPHYFADYTAWGSAPLQRLEESVQHFYSHGIDPIVFFGDPEFTGTATWQTTHDVVRNLTARSYLIDNIQRTLNVPGIANVTKVASLYWLGGSVRCNGHGTQPSCTEVMIAEYNSNLTQVMHQSGVSFWVHLDGPFWDGCWPQPCSHWNVAGYSPASLRSAAIDGIMAESWMQGSLSYAGSKLISSGAVTKDTLLLLNDVPNCDIDTSKVCSTGSVQGDTAGWFSIIDHLNITSWGVWDLIDGGEGDGNGYGDVFNNGTGLTTKGKLHAAHGAIWQIESN